MKSNEMQFDIGDFVIVTEHSVRSVHGDRKVTWIDISYSKPRLGRIVGLVRRWDGEIQDGHSSNDFSWDNSEANYLECTKENIFYEVKLGWYNKPIYVRPQNIRLAALNEIQDLPKLFTQQPIWSDKDKAYLSELVKNSHRDKKGKFCKEFKNVSK